jgi:hypothetical protein
VPADGRRSGEGDLVDAGVAQQRLARDGSAAGDDVHDAVRDTGPLQETGHVEGAERGLVGGLVQHGVAGRERRGDLRTGKDQREVEGHDRGDHAERTTVHR